jgi:hypothetical protein
VNIALALVITVISACCLNLGYLLEHAAASKLPPLSLRHPLGSARILLGNPRWLGGFVIEALGWALYVLALALAPLSVVQAAAAGGIGILAIMVSRITRVPLSRVERIGVIVSIGGLALLGASLVGDGGGGEHGDIAWIAVWLVGSALASALAVMVLAPVIGGGAAWGIAAGILFAAGDVATKTAVDGGTSRIFFIACLVAAYGLGTLALQAGFQRSSALTTAGLATLLTNALPIVAGMTIFSELTLSGWTGAVRVTAFVAVIVGAVLLSARTRGAERHAAAATAEEEREPHPGFT